MSWYVAAMIGSVSCARASCNAMDSGVKGSSNEGYFAFRLAHSTSMVATPSLMIFRRAEREGAMADDEKRWALTLPLY